MANTYDLGEPVRCYTTTPFQDKDGTLLDPPYVRFKARKPGGTLISYVYGVDTELVRNGTGDYEAVITADESGNWRYRFEGFTEEDGDPRGTSEETFVVNPSHT